MTQNCRVDEGPINLENLWLIVWDADDWETIIQPFQVILKSEDFHSLDVGLQLIVENWDVRLSIYYCLRGYDRIYIPFLVRLWWFFVGKEEYVLDRSVKVV